jgi:membrane protein DedA with SNARE-associated domain
MHVESFVQDYGYWAVFFGAMIEGESIILTASILAACGYLSILKVGAITFLGTLIADQSLYYIGYFYGPKCLTFLKQKFPKIVPHLDKAASFLHTYQTLYILSFRFIYGIRIISSLVIGAHHISMKKFAILNIIAAFIWTVLSCALGYFLGLLLKPIAAPQLGLIVTVCITGTWILGFYIHKRKKR